jgi:hypothetical protein
MALRWTKTNCNSKAQAKPTVASAPKPTDLWAAPDMATVADCASADRSDCSGPVDPPDLGSDIWTGRKLDKASSKETSSASADLIGAERSGVRKKTSRSIRSEAPRVVEVGSPTTVADATTGALPGDKWWSSPETGPQAKTKPVLSKAWVQ